MTPEIFRYHRMGYHSPGCGFIGFELERDQRITFPVTLSLEDAERLCRELSEQIRIAKETGSSLSRVGSALFLPTTSDTS
jgi:hypothetical protein